MPRRGHLRLVDDEYIRDAERSRGVYDQDIEAPVPPPEWDDYDEPQPHTFSYGARLMVKILFCAVAAVFVRGVVRCNNRRRRVLRVKLP